MSERDSSRHGNSDLHALNEIYSRPAAARVGQGISQTNVGTRDVPVTIFELGMFMQQKPRTITASIPTNEGILQGMNYIQNATQHTSGRAIARAEKQGGTRGKKVRQQKETEISQELWQYVLPLTLIQQRERARAKKAEERARALEDYTSALIQGYAGKPRAEEGAIQLAITSAVAGIAQTFASEISFLVEEKKRKKMEEEAAKLKAADASGDFYTI